MQCPECALQIPDSARFCGHCGARLARECPRCGREIPPEFKFCGECGLRLDGEAAAPEVVAAAPASAPAADRRQLTVMFCDLVGSTELSVELDPEDLREVVREYQRVSNDVISSFDGHIAQYLGDGLLVYFGYPRAHEDDGQRAVHSALGIVAALDRLNASLEERWGVRLAVRVGIHTGLAVVGEVGAGSTREHLAIGSTPNVAARLQGLAEPGGVAVSETTFRLVQHAFATEPMGARSLKGVARPVAVHRILHELPSSDRPRSSRAPGTPWVVGREGQLAALEARFDAACQGRAQAVWIVAEAGIGKSQLGRAFEKRLAARTPGWLSCQCSAYHQNAPFYPLIGLQQELFGFAAGDDPAQKAQRLEKGLATLGQPLAESVPLMAALSSIPVEGADRLSDLAPQLRKRRTLEILADLVVARAKQRPLVLSMEDLHWSDASTVEFLDLLVTERRDVPLMLLLSSRPTFRPPATWEAEVERIELQPLTPDQVEAMLGRLAGGKPLPREILRQLVERTDGIPLFVEELFQMVLEAGWVVEGASAFELAADSLSLAIPTTLQSSLTARLDRLPSDVKEVSQLAATVGRQFSMELLRVVLPAGEDELRRALRRLEAAGIVHQLDVGPATFAFKHALIRDAAYQSLLKSRRQRFHRRIADALCDAFPDTVAAEPELLAYHYSEGRVVDKALTAWLQVAQRAFESSALVEAEDHLARGLALTRELPEGAERDRWRLTFLSLEGPVLSVARGFSSVEAGRAWGEAQKLLSASGDDPELFPITLGLWTFYNMRADYEKALHVTRQLLDLATARQDRQTLSEAHYTLGFTSFGLGDFHTARQHLETAREMSPGSTDRGRLLAVGVNARTTLGLVLWFLGYPDQALASSQEGVERARRLGHLFSLTGALASKACLHVFRREPQAVRECAQEILTIADEKGFTLSQAQGKGLLGWAEMQAPGGQRRGWELLAAMLDELRAIGARYSKTFTLALVLEALIQEGRVREGRATAQEAFELAEACGETFWEAELWRLAGELAVKDREAAEDEAERCLRRSVDVAARQGARVLELRALLSLGRHVPSAGEEARRRLQTVYDALGEGFATVDLREACQVLGRGSSGAQST